MARRKFSDEDFNDDKPWTEEKWEAFMRDGDLRAARFGELLETLHEDPDHEAKIAHEMGWDEPVDRDDSDSDDQDWRGDEHPEADDDDDDIDVDDDDPDAPFEVPDITEADMEEAGKIMEDRKEKLKKIAAFQIASEIGLKIHQAMRPYAEKYVPPEGQEHMDNADDEDIARLIGQASIGCHIAAAKISGGHAMGYDERVLCGNIVNCRRGLEGVTEGIAAMKELKARKVVPAPVADELLAEADKVRLAVEERIAELRKMVWWS